MDILKDMILWFYDEHETTGSVARHTVFVPCESLGKDFVWVRFSLFW